MTATTADDRAHDLLPATPTFAAAPPANDSTTTSTNTGTNDSTAGDSDTDTASS